MGVEAASAAVAAAPGAVAQHRDVDRFGVGRVTAPPAYCPGCGARTGVADGVCASCGPGAPYRTALPDLSVDRPADRADADLGAIQLITDRGIAHEYNEDAVAGAVVAGPTGPTVVVAVSDGVSTSHDPQAASGAAARAGVDACLSALAAGRLAAQAVSAGLAAAFEAVRGVSVAAGHAPSCTYVSAVVEHCGTGEFDLTVTNVGDSRAYWLTADDRAGPPSQRLTLDDSFAQLLMAGGVDEDTAMRDPRAHALMRWLGADSDLSPDETAVDALRVRGPGVLLLCSDGLWNYLPDPAGLASIATADDPRRAARALVDYALQCGGGDNITVALIPVPAFDGR